MGALGYPDFGMQQSELDTLSPDPEIIKKYIS